jgi:TolB protein
MLSTLGLKADESQPAPVVWEAQSAAPATRPALGAQTADVASPADDLPGKGVNIFGEMGGLPRGLAKLASDGGFQQHTVAQEGYDADVSLDPTGKWLVFSSTRHSEHAHLYLQKVDGQAVTELTRGQWDDVQPAFSPDGKRIAFASTRNGRWSLYLVDADGRNVTQVTNGPGHDMHPSFAPDGNRLVYCSLGRSDQWELWTIDLTTMEKRMVGSGLFPVWSPEKGVDRIAFQRARQRGSRWFSVWTMDLVDGEPRRLTEVAVSASAAVISPAWSPDGKRLAVATVTDPAKADRASGKQDIWVFNSDGAGKQRLTDGGVNLSPVWSPGGRVFFVSDRGGKENVWSTGSQAASVLTADKKDDKSAIGSANE